MIDSSKQLSNPISTGGLGSHFENRVQASFTLLMLANGFSPCLPNWPIYKIKLQAKHEGYSTDDIIVYTKANNSEKQAKLLCNVKVSIAITNKNERFKEVIHAAWSDFNNEELFCEGRDILALICGSLSGKDTDGVRKLIDCAVHSENAIDFISRINEANFTSNNQRDKFNVFKTNLKAANRDVDLTNDQLWRFIKSFRLLIYDLDMKGVTLSLLHTIIEHYSHNNANSIWALILEHVQWENANAGCISLSTIPEEITSLFKKETIGLIPTEFVNDSTIVLAQDWNVNLYSNELAIMCLIGAWNENSEHDRDIICKLSQLEYNVWISKLREILQLPKSPILLKNGHWSLKDRKNLFCTLGSRIFDDQLDSYKKCVILVLKELDPKFELLSRERIAAQLLGKTFSFSQGLRKGLAEGLALIGNYTSFLPNCSPNKPENTIILSLREIFNDSGWILWASLNELLPLIAESNPLEFINLIDSALLKKPCPFDGLFSQEGDGISGSNYMTGLLWGLESLAWEEQFLVQVTVTLGELASRDPGGSWANRPINSLATIFLPWFPQTLATIEKRENAILTLKKELPDITWKLLISILPNKHQSTMGSHKPIWRDSIPKEPIEKVLNKEYWAQINFYARNLVELAKDDIKRLNEIIDNLDSLPKESFDELLQHLSSKSLLAQQEDVKYELWSKLNDFVSKHKNFSEAKWALPTEIVSKIEKVANNFTPVNPIDLNRRLFNIRDYDFSGVKMDWQVQTKILEEKRQLALKTILEYGGLDALLIFVEKVESSANVGNTLGRIDEYSFDMEFFPYLLDNTNQKTIQFINSYIGSKYRELGWKWVDNFNITSWSNTQIAKFFVCLPFNIETWSRISAILLNSEFEYWNIVSINPYELGCDINTAVDKLIENGRPCAAINCIYGGIYNNKSIDNNKIVKALISAITTKESSNTMDVYHFIELIKKLQNDDSVDFNDLFLIEWAYLQLLNQNDVKPKLLENQLASNSNFFCELIQLLYRSKNSKEISKKPSEQERTKALNAWRLLHDWRTPPGMQRDGTFISDIFLEWINKTIEICTNTGHLDVAKSHIGKVLYYCPTDSNGFWINEVVAEELNKPESKILRDSLCSEIYNSRGVHYVDPTGGEEKELANKYRQIAVETEEKGYFRLATSIKNLAESYEKEAERTIEQTKYENE